VETTGNIGAIDMRHNVFIAPHFPGAETLAKITIDQYFSLFLRRSLPTASANHLFN
jgi:hypothetical protein